MTGKRVIQMLTAFFLVLALMAAASQAAIPASASTLSDLQKKKTQLKQQQEKVAQQLKSLKNDKARQQEYKNKLTTQINTVQEQIDNLNDQIGGLNADIKEKESQIAGKQEEIDQNYEKLKERLRALYLTGEASNMEIILNAKNVMDLADKAEIIKSITQYDTNLINTLKDQINSVEKQKSEIEKNRESVSAAKAEYDKKQRELTALVNESNKVLAGISSDMSAAEAQKKQIAKQEEQASVAIDKWYKEYYASQGSGKGSSGSGGYVSKGNFMWPVPSCATVSSPFGPRWGTFHKGIDISHSGIYGAKIVASDSGKVIKAGWGNYGTGYGGYGNVVAINHGGGYSTLYAHMSRVAVRTGQQVKKGQVIGYVGSTGQSTGAHLHFEIRVSGVAKNPMNWFSK